MERYRKIRSAMENFRRTEWTDPAKAQAWLARAFCLCGEALGKRHGARFAVAIMGIR